MCSKQNFTVAYFCPIGFLTEWKQYFTMTPCGRQNGTPISKRDVHVLVPETCEYVTLPGKQGFADVIIDFEIGKLFWILWVGPV